MKNRLTRSKPHVSHSFPWDYGLVCVCVWGGGRGCWKKHFLIDSLPSVFAGRSTKVKRPEIRYFDHWEEIRFQREHGKPVFYYCIKFKMFFNTIKFWNSCKNEQAVVVAVVIFLWLIEEISMEGWIFYRNGGMRGMEVYLKMR